MLRVKVRFSISIIRNLYCVMYFEVTRNIWVEKEIVILFYCNNYGFKKEQGDHLQDIKYTIKKYEEKATDYFLKRYLEE